MTDDAIPRPPAPTFKPGDWAAILGVLLGIGGLIWNAATQSTKIDDNNSRIAVVEKTQATDHDAITGMRSDLRYLVNRAQQRDELGK